MHIAPKPKLGKLFGRVMKKTLSVVSLPALSFANAAAGRHFTETVTPVP
jgi:hypothetical protein